jgi:hypothetical protein
VHALPASRQSPIGSLTIVFFFTTEVDFRIRFDREVALPEGLGNRTKLCFADDGPMEPELQHSDLFRTHCPRFLRGDPNDDAAVDISDAVRILEFLFHGEGEVRCLESANANRDDNVDISDSIYVLHFLFLGGAPPAAPFPRASVGFGLEPEAPCPGLHPRHDSSEK